MDKTKPSGKSTYRPFWILAGSFLVSTMGVIVMIGWWARIPAWVQIVPGFVPMQFNTALCFGLSGCGLCALGMDKSKVVGAFSLGVLAISLPTLTAYLVGGELFLDEWFAEAWITDRSTHPGRMAAATALAFSLFAAGIGSGRVITSPLHARLTLAVVSGQVFLMGMVSAANYALVPRDLITTVQLTRMAIHTTAGFVLLGLCGARLAFRDLNVFSTEKMWRKPFLIGMGICFLGTTGWMGGKNEVSRRHLLRVGQTLENLKEDILKRVLIRENALDRLFPPSGLDSGEFRPPRWELRAQHLMEDFEAIDHVALVDSEGEILADEHQEAEGFEWSPGQLRPCEHANSSTKVEARDFICLGHVDPSRLIVGKPFMKNAERVGSLMFVLDLTEMMREMTRFPLIDYRLTVRNGKRIVYPGRLVMENRARPRFDQISETFSLYNHPLDMELILVESVPILGAQDIELLMSLGLALMGALLTLQLRLHRKRAMEAEALNAKLKTSNRELEDFAYAASHDLQEPLRKIIIFSERLENRSGDALDERGRDYLSRMAAAAERMSRLIQDLLDLSRVGTRAKPMRHVHLNELIKEVLDTLEIRIRETEGRVEVDPLPEILTDAAQMRSLFQNLIENALKFHREGVAPVVRITCAHPKGDPVRIRVEDNGIGIPPEHADRIFKPFSRLHGRAEFPGSGVGLSICKKILHLHRGSIQLEESNKKGAVFLLSLPRSHPEEDTNDQHETT